MFAVFSQKDLIVNLGCMHKDYDDGERSHCTFRESLKFKVYSLEFGRTTFFELDVSTERNKAILT